MVLRRAPCDRSSMYGKRRLGLCFRPVRRPHAGPSQPLGSAPVSGLRRRPSFGRAGREYRPAPAGDLRARGGHAAGDRRVRRRGGLAGRRLALHAGLAGGPLPRASRSRARKLVEAAERVDVLPALTGALAEGRLTLDVFAPLSAVATPATDAELARSSEHWTPKQARRLAADMKGTTSAESAAQFRRRFVRFDDERCLLWAQLTSDSYALVKAAVVGRARRHDHPSAGDPDYVRFESRCADALLDICIERGRRDPAVRGAWSGRHGGCREARTRGRPDHDDRPYGPGTPALRGRIRPRLRRGGRAISAEVARRLACTAEMTMSFDAPDGTCLDQKALQRDPSDAQRIEIRRRDGGCRFPGCTCRNVTDVHHVVWASKQGPTVLSNLLTLCVAHHSRVHELGWTLDGDAQGEVRFVSPQGRVVVSTPSPTWRPPRK